MKIDLHGLPLLLSARAAARRAHAIEESRRLALAVPVVGAPGAVRPEFDLVRRYVRR